MLSGINVVLAMSVLVIVLAVGLIVAAFALDRVVRTRRALAEGPPADVEEEEEEADEVVAGITVGRAPVPRWLYGAYVLIPVFAFAYVFSNVAPAESPGPSPTPTAPAGPVTETTISANQIKFSTDLLTLAADTEVTVTFDNEDAAIHDFTVWETEADAMGGGESVATTGTVASDASNDASFETPAAGETWYFNCTIHAASMFGDIEVEAAEG